MKNRENKAPSKEEKKTKSENILKIAAPIGDNPPEDMELKKRLAKLGTNAPVTAIFQEISKWEKQAVAEDRQHENTELTGRLTTTCR